MKQSFDYLENVAFAATVSDKEGLVLYQNAVARQRDGCLLLTTADSSSSFCIACHIEK